MPGISRKNQDTAGGSLNGGSSNVLVNGTGAVRVGDSVQSHENGIHASSPVMVSGSSTVFVNGIPVCRAGDSASCGHTSTGSSNVIVG